MSNIERIRQRWTDNGTIAREGFPSRLKAYVDITALLDEIDRLTKGLTEESDTLPVWVDDDPPRMIEHGLAEIPARHVEFITHTRRTTPWYSAECPDCQTEFGVHDRRHAEALEAMRRDQSSSDE